MSHPDPTGPAENPVLGEHATIIERPWDNPDGRAVAALTARVGARVVGEHRHPALIERFTVLEGELTLKRDGRTSILFEGETGVVEAGHWHDWWNAADRDARARWRSPPASASST